MPIYTEKVKNSKGKMVDKLIDGKKQYYIRTYVTDEFGNNKQIKRHNKKWLGRDGYNMALREEGRLKGEILIKEEKKRNITIKQLKTLYLEYIKGTIDDDTLKHKEILLNHFCEIDETGQVKTYPNMCVKNYNKELYKKWQIEMKEKKYPKSHKINNSNEWRNYTIKYLNKINSLINNMIQYAIEEGYCSSNFVKQCNKIGTSKELKMSAKTLKYETLTFNEYLLLMDVTKDDVKYNTIFDLLFTRGVRAGELRAFRIKDYNYDKKQIMVNHTLNKKNVLKDPKTLASKSAIDLDDVLNNKIKTLIDELKKDKNYSEDYYIFGKEKPISEHALTNARDKYFEKANIKKHLRLHDFRHSCATWMFSIGIPITVISKILRHGDISVTLSTYTHLVKDDYINALNRLNEIKQVQKQVQKDF